MTNNDNQEFYYGDTDEVAVVTEFLTMIYGLLDTEQGTDFLIAMIQNKQLNLFTLRGLEEYLPFTDECNNLELRAAITRAKEFFQNHEKTLNASAGN